MLKDQIGYGTQEGYLFLMSNGMSPFCYEHWFFISLILQLIVSLLFLWLASRKITPC